MNKFNYFIQKNSSNILTCLAIGGTVATTVLAVKATPRATWLLEDALDTKRKNEQNDRVTLTLSEKIKTVWKEYIPAGLTGMATIGCIIGINVYNKNIQASLISGYELLRQSLDYKNNGYTPNEIIQARYAEFEDEENNKQLFFDNNSLRFFYSTMDKVLEAEHDFIGSFHERGYACLNEYYRFLGIPYISSGYVSGWFDIEQNDPYDCQPLEFIYENVKFNHEGDTIDCCIISTNRWPSEDYII